MTNLLPVLPVSIPIRVDLNHKTTFAVRDGRKCSRDMAVQNTTNAIAAVIISIINSGSIAVGVRPVNISSHMAAVSSRLISLLGKHQTALGSINIVIMATNSEVLLASHSYMVLTRSHRLPPTGDNTILTARSCDLPLTSKILLAIPVKGRNAAATTHIVMWRMIKKRSHRKAEDTVGVDTNAADQTEDAIGSHQCLSSSK